MGKEPTQKQNTQSAAIANPALWPFGVAKGPVEGWLRSRMEHRTPLITDFGHGHRLYPPYTEGGKPRMVQPIRDGGGVRCSGDRCEHAVEGCVHCWEDRFRFGDLKDGTWDPPIAVLRRVNKKAGVPYENVERHLPRPNPTVDGLKSATIMKHARLAMPTDFPSVLADLARTLRREQLYDNVVGSVRRGRGRPEVDAWDIALMAIIRVHDRLSYEELGERIERYAQTGDDKGPFITKPFDHGRVIEAMNGYLKNPDPVRRAEAEVRLTFALEKMRDRLLPLFRDVTTVVGCDGMVLSTAATDNARLARSSRTRAAQVTLHVMYEIRWGIVTAQRLTWHNRGRGSAESPQFWYLLNTTKRIMTEAKLVLADMAFGSARNRAECLKKNVDMYCDIKGNAISRKDGAKVFDTCTNRRGEMAQ